VGWRFVGDPGAEAVEGEDAVGEVEDGAELWEVVADASDVAGAVVEGFEGEGEVLCEERGVDGADEEGFEGGVVLFPGGFEDQHVLAEIGADDKERAAVVDFLLWAAEIGDLLAFVGICDVDDAVGLDGGGCCGGLSGGHRGLDVGFGNIAGLELADRAVGEHFIDCGVLRLIGHSGG